MGNRKKSRGKDLTGPSYLDRLGTDSASQYAPVIKRQVESARISLPLPDHDVEILLDQTIDGLIKQGKIDWSRMTTDRKSIFINAWVKEMTKQGLRG